MQSLNYGTGTFGSSGNATITDVATSTVLETITLTAYYNPLTFSGNTYLTKGRAYRIDFPYDAVSISGQTTPSNKFFTWGSVT